MRYHRAKVQRRRSGPDLTMAERHALLDEFQAVRIQAAPPHERADDGSQSTTAIPARSICESCLACVHQLERIGAVKSDSTKHWLRKFVKS